MYNLLLTIFIKYYLVVIVVAIFIQPTKINLAMMYDASSGDLFERSLKRVVLKPSIPNVWAGILVFLASHCLKLDDSIIKWIKKIMGGTKVFTIF